jgi:hypothetical protein
MESMPDIITTPCHCYTAEDLASLSCQCDSTERLLRWHAYAGPLKPTPLTPAQRAWCIEQINSVEGHSASDSHDGVLVPDKDLARYVMSAWQDNARDKGFYS